MRLVRISAVVAALVASNFLFVAAAPAGESSALKTTPELLLVQRASASHGEAPTAPDCASYQGTVGARTLSDLYLVTPPCRHAVQHRSVPYHGGSQHQEHGTIGSLFWLRPDTLDLGDLGTQRQGPPQFVLASDASPPRTVRSLLAALDPNLAPSYVIDLESEDGAAFEDEGALVSLSVSNSTRRLAQLEYLTLHPLLAHYTLVAVPLSTAIASSSSSALGGNTPYPDVSEFAIKRIRHHLAALEFQPTLSAVLKSLEGEKAEQRIRKDVQVLSGENQSSLHEHEKWVSRHSMSEGGQRASDWVHVQMSSYGFDCTQLSYLTGFAPMVECIYRDSGLADEQDVIHDASKMRPNETVILGAHFDSRGSFGYPTAPGADDDASGTSLVLAVARQIWQHRLQFSRKLVLALFSGEEQGLLSSSYYARKLRSSGEDVLMMLQVDMVGYRKPGEPMQLARPDLIGLKEAGWFVGNVSSLYAPELVVGYTPACCSDHQSYVAQGYPATWIFERNGPIADPCYHNSCDVSRREGYSFEQIAAHTKVAFATVWELAGGRFA
ncbi:hypothetical protein JCM3774_002168 [Rhodotorula dairenensis]